MTPTPSPEVPDETKECDEAAIGSHQTQVGELYLTLSDARSIERRLTAAQSRIEALTKERDETKQWADKCEASQAAWQEKHAAEMEASDSLRSQLAEAEADILLNGAEIERLMSWSPKPSKLIRKELEDAKARPCRTSNNPRVVRGALKTYSELKSVGL